MKDLLSHPFPGYISFSYCEAHYITETALGSKHSSLHSDWDQSEMSPASLLWELHWVSVPFHAQFRVLLINHKALEGEVHEGLPGSISTRLRDPQRWSYREELLILHQADCILHSAGLISVSTLVFCFCNLIELFVYFIHK